MNIYRKLYCYSEESFSSLLFGATGSDVGKANCISSAGGNQTFGPYYCTLSLLVARSRAAEEERVGVGGSPLYSARRGNIFQQPTCL